MKKPYPTHKMSIIIVLAVLFLWAAQSQAQATVAEKVPQSVINAVASGQFQEVIVLFDDSAIQADAASIRKKVGTDTDTPEILAMKASRYKAQKQGVFDALPSGEQDVIIDYSNLPMAFVRVKSDNALSQLLSRPEVVRVYENGKRYPVASSNLNLINQPAVQSLGMTGGGTAVAVLDTGVDYTRSAFGTCTGSSTPGDCLSLPAAPATCKVACVHDFAPSDGTLDADGHGTNVSGIVVAVAPDTKVIGLDVFTGTGAYDSDIINAMNWCIANKAAYNIVAINMSLGDSSRNASQCPTDPFASPVHNARLAGILTAIAAGNDGYKSPSGLSSPACVPEAVSVGAVYDSNIGGVSYSNCSDSTTAADKVTCFSDSATYLTILAPGARITAAGYTMYGTSQATPHIAGSVAVLKGQNAFPSDTPNQTVNRMTSTGVLDLDGLSGITTPRIDLLAASSGGGVTTYSISGTVTYGGSPLSGVTMTLSGAANRTLTTDTSGAYAFTGLLDGSYTVTPGKTGYAFTPSSISVSVNGANVPNQSFTAASTSGKFSISGRVTLGGKTFSGVTMTLTGTVSGTTTTNTYGSYSFSNLPSGTYTVTPNKAGYSFTPSSIQVIVSGSGVANVNFTASSGSSTTYSISGTVTMSGTGTPLANVTMTLSGTSGGVTTTNASGIYTFSGLANGSYTVTPSLGGYTFNPASASPSVNNTSVSGVNFTATSGGSGSYSISGTIIRSSGQPLYGVIVTLSGPVSKKATTDSYGNYTFSGLANGSYTVRPSRIYTTFSPSSRTVTLSGASVTGVNFTTYP